MDKRNALAPTLSRTSPVLFLILIIVNCIINPSYNSFYLLISYIVVNLSNWTIKHAIFKPLYNIFNKKSISILYIGARPDKAMGCGFVNDNVLSTSYGMPSGHSQIAWTVATYIIIKIIKNMLLDYHKKDNKQIIYFRYGWLILSCILILCVVVYISYSRVYIEGCHTIQQVTLGGLLGIISGFIIYYLENDIIDLIRIII